MTREFKRVMSRIRKAQDATLNNKIRSIDGEYYNIEIGTIRGNTISLSVYRHENGSCDVADNRSYYIHTDLTCSVCCKGSSLERFPHIEEVLTEVSNFIGYPV